MKPTFFQKHPLLKDLGSLIVTICIVIVAVFVVNNYVFRSYNVVGKSMENTLHDDDRIFVNRLKVSWSHFLGKDYVPERGEIIVFANTDSSLEKDLKAAYAEEHWVALSEVPSLKTCDAPTNVSDQYIIKRVIAFPGERVVVKDGVMTVYTDENPEGIVFDEEWRVYDDDGETVVEGPKLDVSGEVDVVVPEGEIFVSGDNRVGDNSSDSRNGLGTIPYCRIVGPVAVRLYPFDSIKFF